ncbi:MAG TPA: glycosyltransferase family 2 protein [Vicinamibacteria bacterium]|nr:glycosyltransferase family 2 protein [Vicinamibacteria bacterium]
MALGTGSPPPLLSVVVMAFDEAANLEPVVLEIRGTLDRLAVSAEILIVDDGSTDGTAAVADRLAREVREARVVHHPQNRGLGGVYRTGFAEARGELLTFFPADGQFPASILEAFVPAIEGRDLVVGHVARRDSALGRALSLCERAAYRALIGRLPRFQGVFLVRRARLREMPLRSEGRGWTIVMEMLARAVRAGWRIESLPTPLRPRRSGRSKVQDVRTVWANTREMFALRRRL